MSDSSPEKFKIPKGHMVKTCRTKVKHPRIVSFRQEGRTLVVVLSCGHEVVYCRVPKWTHCYQCEVETIHFEVPSDGFIELPYPTKKIQ